MLHRGLRQTTSAASFVPKRCGMFNDIEGRENHLVKIRRAPAYKVPAKDSEPAVISKKKRKRNANPAASALHAKRRKLWMTALPQYWCWISNIGVEFLILVSFCMYSWIHVVNFEKKVEFTCIFAMRREILPKHFACGANLKKRVILLVNVLHFWDRTDGGHFGR